MVTLREAAQQALEALETCGEDEWYTHDDYGMVQTYDEEKVHEAITALRDALAGPDTLDFETIRRYALEAGIVVSTDTPAQEENARKCFGKFAALVAAHEREECAKVCEARYMGDNNREDMEAKRCAAAIRSRT